MPQRVFWQRFRVNPADITMLICTLSVEVRPVKFWYVVNYVAMLLRQARQMAELHIASDDDGSSLEEEETNAEESPGESPP